MVAHVLGRPIPGQAARQETTSTDSSARSRVETWMVGVYALLLGTLTVLHSCFLDRSLTYDEIVLHNCIHEFQYHNKMTYPAHGHPDAMVVHPPLHYFLVACGMKAGLSLVHAAGAPLVVLSALFLFLVWRSRFPLPVQLALLTALYLAGFAWNTNWECGLVVLRPEWDLLLAWFTGLVALESARLDNWPWQRVFLGGLLLTLAAGMHYIAAGVGFGLVVYAVRACYDLGWRGAMRITLVMAAGACVVAVPYFYFWVIPYWTEIRAVTHQVQGDGGVPRAWDLYQGFQSHFRTAVFSQLLARRPLTYWVNYPTVLLGLPIVSGGVVLLFLRSTRVLAVAALPHLLFVALGVTGGLKVWPVYHGYYLPEFVLSACGVLALCFLTLDVVVRRFLPRRRLAPVGMIVLLGVVLVADGVFSGTKLNPHLRDQELMRAAAQEIVGDDAVLGLASAGPWYGGGGTHIHFVVPDLCYPPDLTKVDVPAYFRHFDAVALDSFLGELTWNKERKSAISFYQDGTLRLRGFVLPDHRRPDEYTGGYLLVASRAPKSVIGFGLSDNHVIRFTEDADGPELFVCLECGRNELSNASLGNLPFYLAHPLPAVEANTEPTRELCTFVIDRERFERLELAKRYVVRDCVPMRRSRESASALLARHVPVDHPVHIYRSFAELEMEQSVRVPLTVDAEQAPPRLVPSTTGPATLDISAAHWLSCVPQETQARDVPQGTELTTAHFQYGWAFNYPALAAEEGMVRLEFTYEAEPGSAVSIDVMYVGEQLPVARAVTAEASSKETGSKTVRQMVTFQSQPGRPFHILISNLQAEGDIPSRILLKEMRAFRYYPGNRWAVAETPSIAAP